MEVEEEQEQEEQEEEQQQEQEQEKGKEKEEERRGYTSLQSTTHLFSLTTLVSLGRYKRLGLCS